MRKCPPSILCSLIVAVALVRLPVVRAGQNAQGEHSADKRDEGRESEAFIEHTGSTNTPGFSVYLLPDGKARYFINARRLQPRERHPELSKGRVAVSLAMRFFEDLKNAMPLSQFPPANCAKSVSFSYEVHVRYQGQESPDLECRSNDRRLRALRTDAENIGEALRAGQK
jgi:hypothetical protein